MNLTPINLIGKSVRMEPLALEHLDPLCEVGLEGDLFRYFPNPVRSREDMRLFIEEALKAHEAKTALPFVTIEAATNKAIGSSRFGNISHRDQRVEIGWTWVAKPWQRTAANTEAKLLMFEYAFERLECHRVELKTDSRNEKSRTAILGIGATQEGILRKHMVMADGYVRDTVYFSVLRSEWPTVKAKLKERLERHSKI